MSDKNKSTKQIVFVFLLLPLVVTIAVIVLIAIRQNLFEKKYTYFTTLQNSIGVSTQTAVVYKGFEIGRVRRFQLTRNGNISVEFYVLKKYHQTMVQNSVMFRSTNPLTNKTTLEYLPDPQSKTPLPDGSTIPSTDFSQGRELVRKLGLTGSDPIAAIIENLTMLSTEFTRDNNADKGALMRTINNVANATDQVDELLALVQQSLREMNTFAENLNRDNNPDAGAVFRTINNLADISDTVNRQMGQMQTLLATTNRLLQNYEKPDSLIVKMLDPGGKQIFAPLSSTLTSLALSMESGLKLIKTMESNSPEINSLLHTLVETMSNAGKTLEALNNNPLLRGGITPVPTGGGTNNDRMGVLPGAK